MAWRKWFVRSVVFTIAALCVVVVVLYQRWTDPAVVRSLVAAKLSKQFPGANVTVESARLRLLGGIVVEGVRLTRTGAGAEQEFVHIPSAVLHHDKEKMLDGELTLRKVELHRPRLKMERDKSGRWNLQGLTGPMRPDLPLPTLVVHQGTLTVADKSEGGLGASLELTDVNLVFLNDPLAQITFEGSAQSELAGPLHVHGSLQRGSGELQLAVHARQVPLQPGWSQRIACASLADKLHGFHLEGKADIRANLAYYPAGDPALSYDVRLQIDQGKVRHPRLPLPLDDLHAVVHCRQGELRLEKLRARSGQAEIEGRGVALLPCPDQTFEAYLAIKRLDIKEATFAHLPDKLRKLQPLFQPSGLAGVRLACARRAGQWAALSTGAPSTVALLPEDMKFRFQRFDYPLEKASGTVVLNLLDGRTQVDGTAYAHDRPVFIKGHWHSDSPEVVDTRFDIVAAEVPINDVLIDALPAAMQQRARSFHAQGKIDVKAHISRAPDEDRYHQEYHARIHDASVRWDHFPLPLKKVSGLLDIYPNRWEFRDIEGERPGGGRVVVQGRSQTVGDKQGLFLDVRGTNLVVDQDLQDAVTAMPQLARAWEAMQPSGKMNFAAVIDRRGPDPNDLEVRLALKGPTMQPRFFPFRLDQVSGQGHYRQGRVEMTQVQARHGQALLSLDRGVFDTYPGGAFYLELNDLQARQLMVDEALIRALPRPLQNPATALNLKDPITLRTRLVIARRAEPGSQPDVFWDSQIWLDKARLTLGVELDQVTGMMALMGRHDGRQLQGLAGNLVLDQVHVFKQPFTNVHAHLQVKEDAPDVLLASLKAPLFGGDVSGQMRFVLGSSLRYELNLTASQIDLQEFGKHNLGAKNQMEGLAVGRLVITGTGAGVSSLEGHGSLDVPVGRLLNLPLLLDLLKFLGLRWPDRTAFEEMHMQFALHGRRVQVRRLELLGNAVSLTGQGDFNLDGTDLNLDFYPSWARVDQLLPAAIRPFPPVLTKNLLTIEMRGQVGNEPGSVKFHKKPLPLLVDPFLQMRDMVMPPSVSAPRNQESGVRGPSPLRKE